MPFRCCCPNQPPCAVVPCKRPLGCCALLPTVQQYCCVLPIACLCVALPASVKQPNTACLPSQLCQTVLGVALVGCACAGVSSSWTLCLHAGFCSNAAQAYSHTSSPPSPACTVSHAHAIHSGTPQILSPGQGLVCPNNIRSSFWSLFLILASTIVHRYCVLRCPCSSSSQHC